MRLTSLIVTSVLSLGVAACSDRPIGPNPDLTVNASLSAVTLADDCASTQSDAPGNGGACLTPGGYCGSLCQQSNMQLSLSAVGVGVATIAVQSVRILDEKNGTMLDEIESRDAQKWNPPKYESWDHKLPASVTLTVSYKLSAPDWGKIDSSGARFSGGKTFRVEVILLVDGVPRTLYIDGVAKEPDVAT
jgi:hypothetical protein